jgi:hypothetical protein
MERDMLSGSQVQHVGFYDENGEWWHTECIAQERAAEWFQATTEFLEAGANDWDDSVPERFAAIAGVQYEIRYTLHEHESALAEGEIEYLLEQQWSDLPEDLQETLVEAFREQFDDRDALTWDDCDVTVDAYHIVEQFVYDSDYLGKAYCAKCNRPIE